MADCLHTHSQITVFYGVSSKQIYDDVNTRYVYIVRRQVARFCEMTYRFTRKCQSEMDVQ